MRLFRELVLYDFNSQPHKEADEALFKKSLVILAISTHSLTRRLTICPITNKVALNEFQLTASQGG